MREEFIPYEEALALRELGFDEPCFAYFNEDGAFLNFYEGRNSYAYPPTNKDIDLTYFITACTAPLYQQVFRWFREKYNAVVVIQSQVVGYYAKILINNEIVFTTIQSYEEAELACIRKLIEITKSKKDE